MTPQQREAWLARITTHGAYRNNSETPEHYIWRSMLARCNNPNSQHYRYYGCKGITVCDDWLTYTQFLTDMGCRPTKEHSLDRIDSSQGYSKSNCRWATRSEQQKNKTTTKWYTDGTFTGTLVECAHYLNITKNTAYQRWKQWGTFEKDKSWHKLQKGV